MVKKKVTKKTVRAEDLSAEDLSAKRVPAIVEGFFEDHGITTCSITLRFKGYTQSFGNLILGKYAEDFKESILHFFGARSFEEVVGAKCSALYSFGYHNEHIEGLEIADPGRLRRFTLTAWRRKHFVNVPNCLESRTDEMKRDIAQRKETVKRLEAELKALKSSYTEWT